VININNRYNRNKLKQLESILSGRVRKSPELDSDGIKSLDSDQQMLEQEAALAVVDGHLRNSPSKKVESSVINRS